LFSPALSLLHDGEYVEEVLVVTLGGDKWCYPCRNLEVFTDDLLGFVFKVFSRGLEEGSGYTVIAHRGGNVIAIELTGERFLLLYSRKGDAEALAREYADVINRIKNMGLSYALPTIGEEK